MFKTGDIVLVSKEAKFPALTSFDLRYLYSEPSKIMFRSTWGVYVISNHGICWYVRSSLLSYYSDMNEVV